MQIHAKEMWQFYKDSSYNYWESMIFFYHKEKYNADWDIKVKWNLDPDTTYIYHGEEHRHDDIGNIHYGYVGAAIFSKPVLCWAAGWAQWKHDGKLYYGLLSCFDDPRDQEMIIEGYDIYYGTHSFN